MFHRTTLISSAATVAVIGALALTGCTTHAPATGTGSDGASGTSSEPATPEIPGPGTPVTVGSFEFTVTGSSELGTTVGTSPFTRTAQGTFIQVDLTVKNVGDSSATFLSNYVTLVDSAGKSYDSDSTATFYASPDQNAWVAGINPGNAIQGPIVFDVPAGTTAVSIRVSDSAFAKGTPINLG